MRFSTGHCPVQDAEPPFIMVTDSTMIHLDSILKAELSGNYVHITSKTDDMWMVWDPERTLWNAIKKGLCEICSNPTLRNGRV